MSYGARLKELESAGSFWGGGPKSAIDELAAILREAWRERTELLKSKSAIVSESLDTLVRAERAEAEVRRLTQASAAGDAEKLAIDEIKRLQEEVRRLERDGWKVINQEKWNKLQAVREAAANEALGNWLGWETFDLDPHPTDKRQRDLRAYDEALQNLHRALDVCKGED